MLAKKRGDRIPCLPCDRLSRQAVPPAIGIRSRDAQNEAVEVGDARGKARIVRRFAGIAQPLVVGREPRELGRVEGPALRNGRRGQRE